MISVSCSMCARMGKHLAAAALAGAVCLFASSAWAATEFKLSNQFPPNHHLSAGMRVFADKVAE